MRRPTTKTSGPRAVAAAATNCGTSDFRSEPCSAKGAWGWSTVRDTRDGRDIALKLMKGSLAGTARRRFEREFRSLATLHHPHCLNVFDYGELDRGPFFTMELFQGRPITSLAGRGVDAMLDPLLQVTLALDYIHNQGIVHRDVKPSNILVRPATGRDGQPGFEAKLMDFGLAKYYGVKSSLSAEAGFVGTVAYLRPSSSTTTSSTTAPTFIAWDWSATSCCRAGIRFRRRVSMGCVRSCGPS